mgnify:CR=1 FL=1
MLARVLTVPMRNGNDVLEDQAVIEDYSSYRTYEEWKHLISELKCTPYTDVLTVPMRNGNLIYVSTLTYVESLVLTVPMRNGNTNSLNLEG